MKTNIAIVIVLFLFSCTTQNTPTFNLQQIQKKNPEISATQPGVGFDGEVLKITPNNQNQSLTVWEGTDPDLWNNARYLVCEIWHD
ncbi:MAG: hypothetical protein JW761_14545, partial [Prolixibacteraceae bacterium]|nr:hypothetical protein [Prolixibacteraceae bacterium]